MHKLLESDKYDLRLQVCTVIDRANNLHRALASEWEYLDVYPIRAFDNLVIEIKELEAMIEHIKSRRKAA